MTDWPFRISDDSAILCTSRQKDKKAKNYKKTNWQKDKKNTFALLWTLSHESLPYLRTSHSWLWIQVQLGALLCKEFFFCIWNWIHFGWSDATLALERGLDWKLTFQVNATSVCFKQSPYGGSWTSRQSVFAPPGRSSKLPPKCRNRLGCPADCGWWPVARTKPGFQGDYDLEENQEQGKGSTQEKKRSFGNFSQMSDPHLSEPLVQTNQGPLHF